MILYHFTSHQALPGILERGLDRGEVPIGPAQVLNAVNLTTDREPNGHGLDQGGHVVTEAEAAIAAAAGIRVAAGTRFVEKRAVRITVRIPSTDRSLKRWLPWARRHCERGFADRLAAAAGQGGRKARTWWLYFGVVPPEAFVDVAVLREPDT